MCCRIDLDWNIVALYNFVGEVLLPEHLHIRVDDMVVLALHLIVVAFELADELCLRLLLLD